jgi:hypothetical protein
MDGKIKFMNLGDMWYEGLWTRFGYISEQGHCEYGNELSGSMKAGNFLIR